MRKEYQLVYILQRYSFITKDWKSVATYFDYTLARENLIYSRIRFGNTYKYRLVKEITTKEICAI